MSLLRTGATIATILLLACTVSGCSGARNKPVFESHKSSRQYLELALESKLADDRRRGVVGLAKSNDGTTDWAAKVYDTLARTDPDAMVRCASLRALANCDDTPRAETCVRILRSPAQKSELVREAPPTVRWCAAQLALHIVRSGGFHDEEREPLVEALVDRVRNESDANARLAMIEALGYFPERRVLEALIDVLGVENFAIQHTAEYSLASLTGVTHDHDQDAWREWMNKTPDPFESAGHMPEPLARQSESKKRWDWLGWWE